MTSTLCSCESVVKFKSAALRELRCNPEKEEVKRIICLARCFEKKDGGSKLMNTLEIVRDNLERLPGGRKEQFLRRALRRAHPTTFIPKEWFYNQS